MNTADNILVFFFLRSVKDADMYPMFLFSILGMGVGSFQLGKFARKVKKWEKLRSMKGAISIDKHS